MKPKNIILYVVGLSCVIYTVRLDAEESFKSRVESKARGIVSEKKPVMGYIENDYASFSVRVDVDRRDRCYEENDLLTVHVKTSREGYLYLIHVSEMGKETLLIPSEFQRDNRIVPNKTVLYPDPDADFQFRVTPPFGRERIKAIVTDRKLKSVDLGKFTKAPATALSDADSRAFSKELGGSRDLLSEWKPSAGLPDFAAHEVVYTSYSRSGRSVVSSKDTRYAVCVGVGKYHDASIPQLEAASKDARAVAKLLTDQCGVRENNCIVLTDENVTRERIREVFCIDLPNTTKPGDIIFVYWSGHGGRYSATSGDRPYTTYLVPFDGEKNNPESTMIQEGPFGQWVQRLDGRKFFFIIDSCYSGGMSKRAKSLGADTESDENALAFRFCFTNFAGSKALGQQGLAVLSSSTGEELSWEREDGKLSVMTHYLIEEVKNGSHNMTHKDIKKPLKEKVTQYNQKFRPQARQTVVEQDELSPGLVLKP